MKKLKIGLIGIGYIGCAHVTAIRRCGNAVLYAVADTNRGLLEKKKEELGLERIYDNVEALIEDPEVDVIHNCTPNHLHLELNKKIIRAGKHIFSEKPVAASAEESAELLDVLKEYPDTVAGVNHNYRMNVMVQDMKHRVAAGEIGTPRLVYGSYLLDWLLYDTDYDWRLEKKYAGASRAVADSGTHWMDTAQTVVGSKITEVFASLETALPVRKRPVKNPETQALTYEEYEIDTEDYGAVFARFASGAFGLFHVSQISPGKKCHLDLTVDGASASLYWNQEEADRLWVGHREKGNEYIFRDPKMLPAEALPYTYMPAGHPEGWNDAVYNNIHAFYSYILDGKKRAHDTPDFATFEECHYLNRLTEAILKSSRTKQWIRLAEE